MAAPGISDACAERAEAALQLVGGDRLDRRDARRHQGRQSDEPATARHRVDTARHQRGGHEEGDGFGGQDHE